MKRCCCFELETGCIIIGWLQLIGSLFAVIWSAVGLSDVHDSAGSLIKFNATQNQTFEAESTTRSMLGTSLGLNIIMIAAAAVLLVGIYKNLHNFILVWLIAFGANILIMSILFLFLLMAAISYESPFTLYIKIVFYASFLLGIKIYLYAAVYSQFQIVFSNNVYTGAPTAIIDYGAPQYVK